MALDMKNAVEEYRYFLKEYLLPLMGFPRNSVRLFEVHDLDRINTFNITQKGEHVFFLADRIPYFRAKISISDDNLRLARNIIMAFIRVAKYKLLERGTDIQTEYLSETLQKKSYEYAIQHGICSWITGDTRNLAVDRLLGILERWSVQTYEGRKVTFGFVINRRATGTIDWLDFLDDDYSATLTDCIHSVIELDEHGKIIEYHSLTQADAIHTVDHGIRPYRFSDVLDNFIIRDKVGIFLLTNGDIIISKGKQIRFVKRNLKWLNMSYEAFNNSFRSSSLEEQLIREIYASMLDVSFSHSGGIISVIHDVEILRTKGILSPSDDLSFPGNVEEELRDKINKHDLKKRLLKRSSLKVLVGECSFYEVDRKLRAELIAMDGACIINPEGKILAIGAIIQNESGSSGGGRGAACKRLSQYGMAIKISTDGYIEVYRSGEVIYSIK